MKEYYFMLETNLVEDDRVSLMTEETGIAGFGGFMLLLVQLRRKEGYRCNVKSLSGIARRYMIPEEVLQKVVYEYGLFEFAQEGEETYFSSPYMNRVMANLEEKRAKGSIGGRRRASTAKRAANGQFTSNSQAYKEINNNLLSQTLSLTEREKGEEVKKKPAKKKEKNESTHTQNEKNSVSRYTVNNIWSIHVQKAFEDKKWLEEMAAQTKVPLLLYPTAIEAIFKQHLQQQSQQETIHTVKEAKTYFAHFIRWESIARSRLMEEVHRQQERRKRTNPYRFEHRDEATGKRSYCGIPIPDEAPPRPDRNAIWVKGGWTR